MTDDSRRAIADHGAALRRRFQQALALGLLAALALGVVFLLQPLLAPLRPWALVPQEVSGLVGVATAPLLHGSFEHLAANAFAVVVLGTLAGTLYPHALLRALPLVWLGSGLGTWLIATGGQHIGASGVTHGLMFFIAAQGLLRRDRSAIAAMMIAMLLFGGMLLSILPQQPGISWEYHLSGGFAGLVSALLWRRLDPGPPRPRYSWEDEDEDEPARDTLEPPRPDEVPVLWQRPVEPRGQVLEFRRREPPPTAGANPDSVN